MYMDFLKYVMSCKERLSKEENAYVLLYSNALVTSETKRESLFIVTYMYVIICSN